MKEYRMKIIDYRMGFRDVIQNSILDNPYSGIDGVSR